MFQKQVTYNSGIVTKGPSFCQGNFLKIQKTDNS